MNKYILLLFCLIPLVSCQSTGQKEIAPLSINMSPGTTSGKVGTILLKDKRLILPETHTSIGFQISSNEIINTLNKAKTYQYFNHIRPDGPVQTLILRNPELLAWVGNGIRSGMGPDGLKILPDNEKSTDTVLLQSDDDSWTIPTGKERVIYWKSTNWLIYVSSVTIGALQDQPPFAADVVIIKQ